MDLAAWLRQVGLERHSGAFRAQEIGFDVLPDLSEADLADLGIPLGDRKRLMRAIRALADGPGPDRAGDGAATTTHPAAGPTTQGERRHLTVMFVDMVGSTKLSTKLDPEELGDVIRAYQAAVSDQVDRNGGYIAKFMGDGVLCYFGYPQAREDAAECAVRAGIAIAVAVARLRTSRGVPIAARIGIASGIVIVGELIGQAEARERNVVGQTPNMAARLQSVASPGQVVIADSTQRLTRGGFELERIETPRLKGFSRRIGAFSVIAERATVDRFDSRRGGRGAATFGREQELAVLRARWDEARAGASTVVLVSGEGGIGKSHLTHALVAGLTQEDHVPVMLQCLPYRRESALFPVLQRLWQDAGINSNDSGDTMLGKVETLLSSRAGRDPDAPFLIAMLMGLNVEGRFNKIEGAPRRILDDTLRILSDYFLDPARRKPLLIVVEDIHWIDPTSLTLLEGMFRAPTAKGAMFLLTGRPGELPAFLDGVEIDQLAVERLGVAGARAIIAELTGGKPLPPELLDEIVTRTDGVPLFVEELTQMVLESDLVKEATSTYRLTRPLSGLAVPLTLQDSLMARLDRLGSAKHVAQTAACIGRSFPHALLAAVCDEPEQDVQLAIDSLVDAGLIARNGAAPEGDYVFRHVLVCDAAYESLLRPRRQSIHARLAETLATRAAPPETLAHHYERADAPLAAAHWLLTAGRRSLEISAAKEAIAYFERGIALIEPLPRGDERARLMLRLHAMLGAGYMLIRSWGADEVEQAYARALDYIDAADDVAEQIWIIWGAWVFRHVHGRVDASVTEARRAMQFAETAGDDDSLLIAHMIMMQVAFYQGRMRDAVAHGEQVERLYLPDCHARLKQAYSLDILLVWLVHGSQAYWLLGDAVRARALRAAADTRARQVDHIHSRVWTTTWGANLDLLSGESARVLAMVPSAVEEAERHGFDYVSRLGRLLISAARLAGAGADAAGPLDDMERSLADFQSTGARIAVPYFLTLKAEALLAAGDGAKALTCCDSVQRKIGARGERWCEPLLYRVRGDVLSLPGVGDKNAARAAYRQAIDRADAQGCVVWRRQAEAALLRTGWLQADAGASRRR